jgi:hypothetical protein
MSCETITDYKGNISEKILIMINEKERNNAKDTILEGVKRHYLPRLKKMKLLDEKRKALDQEIADELKLIEAEVRNNYDKVDFNSYRWTDFFDEKQIGPFTLDSKCWVPKEVKDELQESNKLFALGMKKQARAIWDKLISDYKLVKIQ